MFELFSRQTIQQCLSGWGEIIPGLDLFEVSGREFCDSESLQGSEMGENEKLVH